MQSFRRLGHFSLRGRPPYRWNLEFSSSNSLLLGWIRSVGSFLVPRYSDSLMKSRRTSMADRSSWYDPDGLSAESCELQLHSHRAFEPCPRFPLTPGSRRISSIRGRLDRPAQRSSCHPGSTGQCARREPRDGPTATLGGRAAERPRPPSLGTGFPDPSSADPRHRRLASAGSRSRCNFPG
jgi:hypothetical protein